MEPSVANVDMWNDNATSMRDDNAELHMAESKLCHKDACWWNAILELRACKLLDIKKCTTRNAQPVQFMHADVTT